MTKRQLADLLLEVYNDRGPRTSKGVVPATEFAAMTDEQVEQWDFGDRFLMRRIAKAIASVHGQSS